MNVEGAGGWTPALNGKLFLLQLQHHQKQQNNVRPDTRQIDIVLYTTNNGKVHPYGDIGVTIGISAAKQDRCVPVQLQAHATAFLCHKVGIQMAEINMVTLTFPVWTKFSILTSICADPISCFVASQHFYRKYCASKLIRCLLNFVSIYYLQ